MAVIPAHRRHALWFAHLVHRISGLLLALFLPVHFYVLALALEGAPKLDQFLRFSDLPLVKAAEFVLVLLLAVHLFGGIRLLALEWLPWSPRQKTWAALAVAGAFFAAIAFALSATS